jgi:hypothetical protein
MEKYSYPRRETRRLCIPDRERRSMSKSRAVGTMAVGVIAFLSDRASPHSLLDLPQDLLAGWPLRSPGRGVLSGR